jgi:uncharacterized protein
LDISDITSETKQGRAAPITASRTLLLFAATYLLLFAAAEYITFYVADWGGVILHFAILLSLIAGSAITKDEAKRKLWLSLGLVPLIRIVSLAIPIPQISEVIWYILFAVPVLLGIFILSLYLKLSPDDLGLNVNRPLVQALVALSLDE